jgi:hypothetical protein
MNLSQGNLSSYSSKIKTQNNYKDMNNFNISYNVYSTLRAIKKRKKSYDLKYNVINNFRNNNSKISIDFDNLNSQNNDLSLKNSSCIKYKSENISTYKQLNTTNNTSNILNNNESVSTYPSNLKKKIIIDLPGKKFLNKQNYGKLLLFTENIREERYQKYFNNILSNEYYYQKEKTKIKPKQLELSMYNYRNTEKYLKSFMYTLRDYTRNFNTYTEEEKTINEKLKIKENTLKSEINRLKQKKKKLLEKFLSYLEMKKFLLHVKNKTLSINKFKLNDYKEILKDEDKKELVLNDYKKIIPQRNSMFNRVKPNLEISLSKRKESPRLNKMKNKKNENKIGNTIVSKRESDLTKNNDKKSNSDEIINKPIFETVDSFLNIYDILNSENAKFIIDYDQIQNENTNNKHLLMKLEREYEEYKIEKEKKHTDEIKGFLNEKNILKEKYEELIQTKKYLDKKNFESEKVKNMNKIIKLKIYNIYQYINKNYKKFIIQEDLLHGKNISIARLEVIENVINKLSIEKEIFMKNFPVEYKNYRIATNLKEKLDNIEKRKKNDMEKERKLMQKVYENANKIILLPKHKIIEKYNFKKKINK